MEFLIKGFLKTSLIEWPGEIAAVIFLPHCNFRCPFCHNSDLVLRPQNLTTIPEDEVLVDLAKRRSWIDGVVITGGEPTLQPNLPQFLLKIKQLNLKTMLETNGSHPEMLQVLFKRNLLDYLSMDLKAPFDERYQKATGIKVNLSDIQKSMNMIRKSGVNYELRTTVVPGFLSKVDLFDLAESIPWAKRWFLQQFVPHNTLNPEFTKIKPYSKKEMEKMTKMLREIVRTVRLRGV